MDFERSTDWISFDKLDSAATIDFLSSMAGALLEAGHYPEALADELRISLKSLPTIKGPLKRPLIVELNEQGSRLVKILELWYSPEGLARNLLRLTLRGLIAETIQSFTHLCDALIEKANQGFNQNLFIVKQHTPHAPTLYAAQLTRLAEHTVKLAERLSAIHKDLAIGYAGGYGFQELDQALARSVGFNETQDWGSLDGKDEELKHELTSILTSFAREASRLAATLGENHHQPQLYPIIAWCDTLTAECKKLSSLTFPDSTKLAAWELKRRHIAFTIVQINSAIQATGSSLETMARPETTIFKPWLSSVIINHAALALVTEGVPPNRAEDASQLLAQYLKSRSLAPHEVVDAELMTIHPDLRPSALKVLRLAETNSSLSTGLEPLKMATRAKQDWVTHTIKSVIANTLVFLILCFSGAGCGLKTAPKSDLPDLRPDIPFHDGTVKNQTNSKASKLDQNPLHPKDLSSGERKDGSDN